VVFYELDLFDLILIKTNVRKTMGIAGMVISIERGATTINFKNFNIIFVFDIFSILELRLHEKIELEDNLNASRETFKNPFPLIFETT
jgi:hypothetical protein